MRRLILVLFALALMGQGALASLAPGCLADPCCAEEASAPWDSLAPVPADDAAASHVPCDAADAPCGQDGCHCHEAAFTALLVAVPVLPPAGKAPIVSAPYLQPSAQHVPDGPQRPPRAGAR